MEKLPSPLFKAYDKKEYADFLINKGIIQFGSLASYREIEDETRQDRSEGEGRQKVPGVGGSLVNHSVVTTHPLYAFCLCGPTVSQDVLQEFGHFTVRITNPEALLRDVDEYVRSWAEKKGRSVTIDACPVSYDKDERGDCSDAFWSLPEWRLVYAQKPRCHERDREVRIVAMLSGDSKGAPKFLKVVLKHFTEYVQPEGQW